MEKLSPQAHELVGEKIKTDEELEKEVLLKLIQKYGYKAKINEIFLKGFMVSLENTFGSLENVKEKRILDLGCGSLDSSIDTNMNKAKFEPWFPRLMSELGAIPVGVDIGNLEGEEFEHYKIDLIKEGALDFLPDNSFDGINVSMLFDSPRLRVMLESVSESHESKEEIMIKEIKKQVSRLLKEDGKIIEFG